jgi:dinuclear metal center YbgI/SA1388 family protein
MKVHEVISIVEDFAPISLQESYDNSGLQVGSSTDEVKAILCTVDITPEVVKEAMDQGVNLIISHHPVIFKPLTSLTGKNADEEVIMLSIRNQISIFCAHTNLDNSSQGVNKILCEKLGLLHYEILSPISSHLYKLVTYVPEKHAMSVREALFKAGAGHIGNYDSCSYNIEGTGTFRAGENTNPFVGEKGKVHYEAEIRIETIVPEEKIQQVVRELYNVHPYEEVAYDLYRLENLYKDTGAGMIGELEHEMNTLDFLNLLKQIFQVPSIRYSGSPKKTIKRIALCGGAGSFLIEKAISKNADAFLTSDIKYHQFFGLEKKLLLCDIGHYESEQFTKEFFYHLLNKKISTFAVHLSKVVTNPIKYYF